MRSEVPAAARRRPAAGLLKVSPLPGETTLSFIERLASTFRLTGRELLRLLPVDGPKPLFQQFQADGEAFLDAETRTLLAAFCAVPEEHLRRALPAWDRLPPGEVPAEGHVGVRFRGASLIADTCTACRMCTAQRTGQAVLARLYRPSHARICTRHQTWLIGPHPAHHDGDHGVQISLRRAPEVAAAQRRHLWLVRRRPHMAEAFAFAHAVVAGWWAQQWDQDGTWQRRFASLAGSSRLPGDPWQQRVLTRDAVIYPEAVGVAMLLTDPQWQRRVAADTRGHLPHALADVPALLGELARRLERPRLAGLLAPSVNGPLIAWVRACSQQGAGTEPAQLWRVASAHRPAPVDKLLRAHRKDTAAAPPVLPSTTQHSFGQGLVRARAYAAEHGHLCVTAKGCKNGFDLGQWLARQRAAGPDLAPGHAAALAALDEWWNPPWPLAWQSRYYKARAQTRPGTVLAPELGFPGTPHVLRRWLYAQCEAWDSLHPRQQQLLAGIGVTAEQAALSASRHTALTAHSAAGHEGRAPGETLLATALDLAHGYAAEHGHLCPAPGDHRDGFPLGAWLTGLRRQAKGGTIPQAPLLTAIDPWWNPPWPLTWQRRYGSVRTHTRSEGPLDPTAGFTDLPPHTRRWLHTQLTHYDQLAPAQQDLLSDVGITAGSAKAARAHAGTEHQAQEDRLALAHAYAAEHGHLHIPPAIQYHGFALGQWLQQQRAQARSHEHRTGSPRPASRHLAALDPWWNPPWTMQWERHHRAARAHALAGNHLDPTQGFPGTPDALGDWLYRQCTGYQRLHPRQQELLTDIGITAEQAALVRRRRSPRTLAFQTGHAHARAYAAAHGHLAAPGTAVHDGYPVGRWLATQRKRAANHRLYHGQAHALNTIDPWWNPPWPLAWQRTWHHAHTHHTTNTAPPRHLTAWTTRQRTRWNALHPQQRQLLTTIGITGTGQEAWQ